MADKSENPPAFPVLHSIDGNWVKAPLPELSGMSLRDWFAGQVLAGFYGSTAVLSCSGSDGDIVVNAHPSLFAAEAYHMADAMLAERAKEQP